MRAGLTGMGCWPVQTLAPRASLGQVDSLGGTSARQPDRSLLCCRKKLVFSPTEDKNIKIYDMYVGLVNLRVAGSHTQWYEVDRVILHPSYEVYHPIGGDVALVQLKSRIVFSDSVLPVCLPPADLDLSSANCWATGWGLVSQRGETSDELQEVQLPLIPRTWCRLLYGHMSYIMPDMLCAGDILNIKTVCEVRLPGL
ncbi:Serine protease 38 [Saguinus oedipus]|uniref:Serine protease 38 n=1 Tax=Saguinus oedipus TaxID=9490 RepID=A0ABQ9TMB2_SAGOE|nr:Serine protease 38 [Saguinus oedipus]